MANETANSSTLDLELDLQMGTGSIKSVRSELMLPNNQYKRPKITLFPTEDQINQIEANLTSQFSLKGKINDAKALVAGLIEASNVWVDSISLSVKTPTVCDPVDLVIKKSVPISKKGRIKGHVSITANELLQPAVAHWPKKKRILARQFKYFPTHDVSLWFDENENCEYDTESHLFPELVCKFTSKRSLFQKQRIIDVVNDVVLLASFAARRHTVCTGITYLYGGSEVFEYFGDRTLPRLPLKENPRGQLIELSDFSHYMKNAFRTFSKLRDREEMRRLLNFTLTGTESTLEGDFVSLYAALEMFISRFRKDQDLEFIFPESKFGKLRKEINKAMMTIDFVPFLDRPIRNSARRAEIIQDKTKLIKDKLGELNRVAFGTALTAMTEHYSVSLDDLWPVTGKGSLSDIRNRIVHGSYFGREHSHGLIFAREHLRWVLERLLLSFLNVPLHISNVSPAALALRHPYSAWEDESKYFK
ncbi:MAG: hypothetical protein IPI64_08285 [Chloracidobacterium sp.]|nr:hypothetical protein [Chloracidobacterium sp.]